MFANTTMFNEIKFRGTSNHTHTNTFEIIENAGRQTKVVIYTDVYATGSRIITYKITRPGFSSKRASQMFTIFHMLSGPWTVPNRYRSDYISE